MGGYGFMTRYQRNPMIRGFLGTAGSYAARRIGNYFSRGAATAVVPYRRKRTGGYKPKRTESKKEVKAVDYTPPPDYIVATTSTSDNVYFIHGVAPGTGFFNRIGRYQYVKSLNLKLCFQWDYVGSPSEGPQEMTIPNVRLLLVLDKQVQQGAFPAWDDIFGSVNSSGDSLVSVFSPPSLKYSTRFKVLRDVWLKSSDAIPYMQPISNGAPTTSTMTFYREYNDFLKVNVQTLYAGGSDQHASVESGAVYLILRTEAAPVDSNDNPLGRWRLSGGSVIRTRYTD